MKFTYHKNGILDLRSLPKAGKIKTAIGSKNFERINSAHATLLEISVGNKAMSLDGTHCWESQNIYAFGVRDLMEVLCIHCRHRLAFLAGGSRPCTGLHFKPLKRG